MSITATPDPIADAYAVDEKYLIAADQLAAKIAAGEKLDPDDDVRATFGFAQLDEAGAAREVERHRRVITQRRLLEDGRAAAAEVPAIEARAAKIRAERDAAEKRFRQELIAVEEPLAHLRRRAAMAKDAERELTYRLLPSHITRKLSARQTRRAELAELEHRLRGNVAHARPIAVDRNFLAQCRFERSRKAEIDRVAHENAKRTKVRELAETQLSEIRAEVARIDAEDTQLRSCYL